MTRENGQSRGIIDQNLLKWIAVISMTIDHTGMVLFPQYRAMRLIGRLAFPIYCYLLVQGFEHTRSRKKYMARLGVFAFLSEIPFDLACYGTFSWKGQNVFLTLFLCLGMLALMEWAFFKNTCQSKMKKVLAVGSLLAAAVLTHVADCDYGFSAPFLVAGLYLYVKRKRLNKYHCSVTTPWFGFCLFLAAMFLGWMLEGYSAEVSLNGTLTEAFCLPAAWLIQICSGKRRNGGGKYFFYIYYPLHLLILYGLQELYF